MKAIVKNWYNIAVYIALAVTVVLALGEWAETQRILLASLAVIHLHFFEEFQLFKPVFGRDFAIWAETKRNVKT